MQQKKIHGRMFENIYDLIKVTALSNKQQDGWATLSRKFGNDAKKELGNWIRNKDISISNNIITIGKHFVIKMQYK